MRNSVSASISLLLIRPFNSPKRPAYVVDVVYLYIHTIAPLVGGWLSILLAIQFPGLWISALCRQCHRPSVILRIQRAIPIPPRPKHYSLPNRPMRQRHMWVVWLCVCIQNAGGAEGGGRLANLWEEKRENANISFTSTPHPHTFRFCPPIANAILHYHHGHRRKFHANPS